VARRLVDEHPDVRMKLVGEHRAGAPRARNAGVAASSGDYILPLDCDDTIEPEMLEATAAEMDADEKVAIVYTYTRHVSEPEAAAGSGPEQTQTGSARAEPPGVKRRAEAERVQTYPDFDLAYWIRNNPQLDSCSLVRREAFEQAGGYDPDQFAEDLDLWLGIVKRGWRAKLVPRPLFNYWHHGGHRESTESWTRPVDLRWQLIHKHPELFEERERLFVSALALAFVLSDSVKLAQQVSSAKEAGLEWTSVTIQADKLAGRYSTVLVDCEDLDPSKLSESLARSVSGLLSASRKAGEHLLALDEACRSRDLNEAVEAAEGLIDALPAVGQAMMTVHQKGMAEIYGPGASSPLVQ